MSFKKDDYFEFSLRIQRPDHGLSSEILKKFLISLGVSPDSLVETEDPKGVRISVYFKARKDAQRLCQNVQQLGLKDTVVRLKELKQADWRDKWKKDFHSFALTKRFDVVPFWERKHYKIHSRIPIYITAINAFGTGLHETTMFMAQLIEKSRGRFRDFLDIGTGSGILSIMAWRSGATRVYGVDYDREALKAAKINLAANGLRFTSSAAADIQNYACPLKFDFVAANLVTHDLIRLRKKILAFVKPGGFLAISGISLENLNKIQAQFQPLPLQCRRIHKGKEWVAILYQRKISRR